MKILVHGANNTELGRTLYSRFSTNDDYIFTDTHEWDTPMIKFTPTNYYEVLGFIKKNEINIVINCIEWGELFAGVKPLYFANAMKEVGGLLIQMSSANVFRGKKYNTPISETALVKTNGVTNFNESDILNSGCDYIILRTSWMYGIGSYSITEILSFLKYENIKAPINQVSSPTYAVDVADVIDVILHDYSNSKKVNGKYAKSGIYHYSNEGVCSWYDFVYRLTEIYTHDWFTQEKRPIIPTYEKRDEGYFVLDNRKIKETFGITIPYWVDSLKKYVKRMWYS